MIATIPTSKLQEILDNCTRFVSKSSTLPVLENIYIKAESDKVVFKSTDMEKYIQFEINTQVEAQGGLTVNAKVFSDIIRSLDDDEVKLEIDENTDMLTINTTSDVFKVKGISISEYVAAPSVSSDVAASIKPSELSKGIDKVAYAVTERNFSPVLTGVLLKMKQESDGNKLVFVGTDSLRLAEYKIPYEGEFCEMELVIPKINIIDIKKMIDYVEEKGGTKIDVSFSENMVSFVADLEDSKIYTTSVLIQGNFPNYDNESIIPRQYNTEINTDKMQLEKSIKKVSILTKDVNNFVNISNLDEKKIVVRSGETDKGEADTNINASIDGSDFKIGINGKYISDFIKVIESDNILINIVDNEKPVVFKDELDENLVYVIRPLVD
ncbi:DNA polymerase III subunit beta [Candidatus Absconditicoccus praedator]|uniref:DNA polymerase III subunit beta n=1 Tax=Candidatus Absconditicoccus praedator TaxID=2735562 RepID=UPI001E37A35A|nr:DNA polymerase III subunit beta [Candidatus Absconditicoccus praedator]UFX83491.1 DNA polymerase III subunit beta [Candidatus Absconditicoccus praedator]